MRALIAATICGVLAGCQVQRTAIGSTERETIVPAELDETLARTDQVLTELGFERRENGVARADFDGDTGWAQCEQVKVLDATGRNARRNTDHGYVDLVVFALPREAGTRVVLQPRFVGLYPRRDSPEDFEYDCASTGVLEQTFLQRLRALDAASG